MIQRMRVGVPAAAMVLAALGCTPSNPDLADAAPGPFAEFVEPGFPFIVSTVNAREAGPTLPDDNVATRGVVLMLGDSTYATFDPDLLRMAIGWRGDFLSLTTMAQISYRDSLNKNNQIPEVLGRPVFATGIYPGWAAGEPDFRDPRAPGPYPPDPGRGPLDASVARWEGVYVVGDRAVLAYTVRGTEIRELPASVSAGGQVGIERTIRTGPIRETLTLVAAESRGAQRAEVTGNIAVLFEGNGDTVTVVGLAEPPRGARLDIVDERYVTVTLPRGLDSSLFRVVLWRGAADDREAVEGMLDGRTRMIAFEKGGPAHWKGTVRTRAELAPDTAAYVVDEIALPVQNPWRRNIRPADVAFFSDGRAAVATFEGDVWIVSGLDGDLERVEWRRFASGLYEPMSLEIVDDQIYVYSRSGLVRPQDLNRDGEADYYENFSDLSIQTMESREFPLSMGKKPGGGFYLSRGGALNNGPRTSPMTMPGFRAGSAYSGSVVEISPDGRGLRVFATGLREPFIGVHPERDVVTASDQQGNFVPSTPIYQLENGGYYGVPATAHRKDLPRVEDPVAWIPHEVDQSGAGQAWVPRGGMGFGEDALIHVSYGRPGVFRVYYDEAAGGTQGAVVALSEDFAAPLLKGEYRPQDGSVYVTGFQIWGTRAQGIRVLSRLRHTGRPSPLPEAVSLGEQGVLVRFGIPVDAAVAEDPSRYTVARWNYQRTEEYGSGHFRLDGSPGQERLPVASAHVAPDGQTVLLVLPDMREVMQLQVSYDLRSRSGEPLVDTLYTTVNALKPLDLASVGLEGVDWRTSIASVGELTVAAEGEATAAQGEEVFRRTGCVACHSVDGTTSGKPGPTLLGLFGRERPLADGGRVQADEEYVRRSIETPGAQIAEGYQEGMPAYLGVLSDGEIESLVLYIRSLGQ